jgi:hypothetical protein
MNVRNAGRVLAALALVVITGCGTIMGERPDPFAGATPGVGQLIILMENFSREDVIVEMIYPGARESLGRLDARSRSRVILDWRQPREVQFQVQIVAGPRQTIRGFSAAPGDLVDLVVQSPIDRSFARRR